MFEIKNNAMVMVISFLETIGIKVIKVDCLKNTFIDEVKIVNGSIHITPYTQISNLLHEAGHLAIIPENIRHLADGDLDDSFEKIFQLTSHLAPEHAIQKVLIQCSDPEATAWAWATGSYLGIPPEEIIRDDDYQGEGASIRTMLACCRYFGINGLSASGMTTVRSFPLMKVWAQPVINFE